jgi:hypothetical protein
MPGKGAGRPIRNDFREFEGRRYTWTGKGYWRCTSYYDRHNLAHRIWTRAHGKPVPKGSMIVFADGNKFNVSVENLLCLTYREAQLRRMQNPEYRAITTAYLAYGLLVNGLMEANDPEKKRVRFERVVQTRRETGSYEAGSERAWKTKRERYGSKGRSMERTAYDDDQERRHQAALKAWRTRRSMVKPA